MECSLLRPAGLGFVMHEVEIQDGVIQVDASIIGKDLGLEPCEVQRLMREGKLTSYCERGIDEDDGHIAWHSFMEVAG